MCVRACTVCRRQHPSKQKDSIIIIIQKEIQKCGCLLLFLYYFQVFNITIRLPYMCRKPWQVGCVVNVQKENRRQRRRRRRKYRRRRHRGGYAGSCVYMYKQMGACVMVVGWLVLLVCGCVSILLSVQLFCSVCCGHGCACVLLLLLYVHGCSECFVVVRW